MKSITKSIQSTETITRMVEKYFKPLEMKNCTELNEGYFNVAYEIELSDESRTILKIAPDKSVRIMTCEKNIMAVEVEAMKQVQQYVDVPVPEIYGFDDSCTVCQSPYFFMEKLKGKSLNSVKEMLTEKQLEDIYFRTGNFIKEVNSIICPCFGYPGQHEFQGKQWYSIFYNMIQAGISDALCRNINLQISIDELMIALEKDKDYFEDVQKPQLVHWDCWDGNIFVEDGNLTGIIDWERSLWADPLMEVGFRTYDLNIAFLKGYGMERLDERQQRRALWYDIYFLIIASLECEYRKYETMGMYEWATELLKKQFKKIINT